MKGLYDSINRPWLGAGFSFVALVINVPANWILIHGWGEFDGYGLIGAGYASIIAQLASLFMAALHWRLAPACGDIVLR